MNYESKIKQINELIESLALEAESIAEKYNPSDCPMGKGSDHYKNAQILDGLGCWMWHCPFCGKVFSE